MNKSNSKSNMETTSFLKTIESTSVNKTSSTNNIQDKEIDEIICKYLDLKKTINLFWNKIG
jgi:hypothetical protein